MTIIQTYEEYFLIVPGLILLFIGAVLCVGFSVSLYYEPNSYENFKIACIVISILLLFVSFTMLICGTETRHQIIVDDNTSFSTVQQKYKIIEQKGISYIVKDIEKND